MSTRLITSDMWEDDFFTELDLFGRLIWIGLITGCADDQGRLQDNAALIRSKVFPVDDIKLSEIEGVLKKLAEAGKITRYSAGEKKLIQIVTWWKHQKPRWAGKSIYTAPEGWIDRERYHTYDNKIIALNWDVIGGYIDGYIGGYIPTYTTNDVNDDVNGDVKGDVDVDNHCLADNNDNNNPDVQPEQGYLESNALSMAFEKASGISFHDPPRWIGSLEKMEKMGIQPVDIENAVLEMTRKNYNIVGIWSIYNPAITCMGNRKRALNKQGNDPPKRRRFNSETAIKELGWTVDQCRQRMHELSMSQNDIDLELKWILIT